MSIAAKAEQEKMMKLQLSVLALASITTPLTYGSRNPAYANDAAVTDFINHKLKKLFSPLQYLQALGAAKRFVDSIEAGTNKIAASTNQLATLEEVRLQARPDPAYRKYYKALRAHIVTNNKQVTTFCTDPIGNKKILLCLIHMIQSSTKINKIGQAYLIAKISNLLGAS